MGFDLIEQHHPPKPLVLWRQPILTLKFFCLECVSLTRELLRSSSSLFFAIIACFIALLYFVEFIRRCTYWFVLGVLSSIGLGSGLHTFVLYLAPHIIRATLELRHESPTINLSYIFILSVLREIWLDSFIWALGTAIGELPPFLLARKAAQHSKTTSDEHQKTADDEENYLTKHFKEFVRPFVERYGFLTIFLCASFPNPFFDIGSMMCGKFSRNMSVKKFLFATALGKAGVKIHVQILSLIVAFGSQQHGGEWIKWIEGKLSVDDDEKSSGGNFLAAVSHGGFSIIIFVLSVYFVVSIVNAMAQDAQNR